MRLILDNLRPTIVRLGSYAALAYVAEQTIRQEAGAGSLDLIVGITGVITVLVSLAAILNTSRTDAFKDLQKVNEALIKSNDCVDADIENLKRRIETLDIRLEHERRNRMWLEDYNRVLIRVITDAKLIIPQFAPPPLDDVDTDGAVKR